MYCAFLFGNTEANRLHIILDMTLTRVNAKVKLRNLSSPNKAAHGDQPTSALLYQINPQKPGYVVYIGARLMRYRSFAYRPNHTLDYVLEYSNSVIGKYFNVMVVRMANATIKPI